MSSRNPSEADRQLAVAEYYNYTVPFYRLFWHGRTAGLHYGLAESWTSGPADELINTNRFLANVSRIDRSTRVLDAGCGIGGSAIWLASHLGAEVVGLTLSTRQAAKAADAIARRGLSDRVTVTVADYANSGLADGSFDVVWAIESACYAVEKRDFIREAFRLLRPGGRLVVADGFLRRPPAAHERPGLDTFLRGLVLPNLSEGRSFSQSMEAQGFVRVTRWDKTQAAKPSSRRLFRRCRAGYPISLAGERLGIIPALMTENIRAGLVQLELVECGLIAYEVICGTKPEGPGLVAETTR